MRVIAGSARRLRLKTIEGLETRPTTDRIKETLFNILNFDLPGCRFLDLFAGSGGIGIEALSRGAKEAVFVDSGKAQTECIRENLSSTGFTGSARVIKSDAVSAVKSLSKEGERFDIIYMDPPYRQDLERDTLKALNGTSLCDNDTLIIIETFLDADTDWIPPMGYEITRIKEYKTSKHVFLRQKES